MELPLIAIVGPTASGKTAVACALAELLDGEVLSADSRQIYRYLDIGTAKPGPDELARARHHFIDIKNPDEYYSAGLFAAEARPVVLSLLERGIRPIVAGGSGLYVQALCQGFFSEEADSSRERAYLEERLQREGIDALYARLQELDPRSAERYSDRNPRRILRALEYTLAAGIPFSRAQEQQSVAPPFQTMYFGIAMERAELYDRINRRSAMMFEQGILAETERVLAMGYSPELNALNTVGYKECIACLQGAISRERAQELTAQKTRNYGKRQLTWFRRNTAIQWLDGAPKEIAQTIADRYICAQKLPRKRDSVRTTQSARSKQ